MIRYKDKNVLRHIFLTFYRPDFARKVIYEIFLNNIDSEVNSH